MFGRTATDASFPVIHPYGYCILHDTSHSNKNRKKGFSGLGIIISNEE